MQGNHLRAPAEKLALLILTGPGRLDPWSADHSTRTHQVTVEVLSSSGAPGARSSWSLPGSWITGGSYGCSVPPASARPASGRQSHQARFAMGLLDVVTAPAQDIATTLRSPGPASPHALTAGRAHRRGRTRGGVAMRGGSGHCD